MMIKMILNVPFAIWHIIQVLFLKFIEDDKCYEQVNFCEIIEKARCLKCEKGFKLSII